MIMCIYLMKIRSVFFSLHERKFKRKEKQKWKMDVSRVHSS